jgi:hypothetical protein
MTPSPVTNSNEEGPSPKIEAAVDGIELLLDLAAMDISTLEAQLTEVSFLQPDLFKLSD